MAWDDIDVGSFGEGAVGERKVSSKLGMGSGLRT